MTENTNTQDPRLQHFVLLAKGLHDVGEGRKLTDRGRARIVVGMVMAAKSTQDNVDGYNALIRACQGLHADPKNAKNAFAEGWAFFRDNMRMVRADMPELKRVKEEDLRTDRFFAPEKKKDDDMGPTGRAQANAPVSARSQALMFAASVLVQFDACKVNWQNVEAGKNDDVILTNEENMLRLYEHAKKDKSIRQWEAKDYPIGTFGNFRFTTLAELGNEELRRRGLKKAAPERKTADTTAMRDRLSLIAGDLDKADAKSYDAPPDQNVALKAFVGIANALNDGTLKGARFDNVDYTAIDWIVEGMSAVNSGQPIPPQYKALRDFVTAQLDKNVAKPNGGTRKAA